MFGSPEFSWIVMDVVKSKPEVRLWPTWDGPTLMFLFVTDERRSNLQEREMRNEKNSIIWSVFMETRWESMIERGSVNKLQIYG